MYGSSRWSIYCKLAFFGLLINWTDTMHVPPVACWIQKWSTGDLYGRPLRNEKNEWSPKSVRRLRNYLGPVGRPFDELVSLPTPPGIKFSGAWPPTFFPTKTTCSHDHDICRCSGIISFPRIMAVTQTPSNYDQNKSPSGGPMTSCENPQKEK